eukprot:gnl/MRDRNA2_/MRDRNA2_113940_c0_seq1.p1 gnl/MRDRNA2_/MRDRNA2_113940_c0~~gnl/MRDRNA2_/MRDRNA2_113940_c0_seq1.p1  ORF type:complete len:331 (+),score=85.30 gnl/MRDRNA2_/MRDRNA2_113940_c0_seq1:98-1090(+)
MSNREMLTGTQKKHLEMAKKMGMYIPDVKMQAYNYKTGELRTGVDTKGDHRPVERARSRSPRATGSATSSMGTTRQILFGNPLGAPETEQSENQRLQQIRQASRAENRRRLLENERFIREREELKEKAEAQLKRQQQEQSKQPGKIQRLGPVMPREENLEPIQPVLVRMQQAEEAAQQAREEHKKEADEGDKILEAFRQKRKQQEEEERKRHQAAQAKKKKKKKRSSRYDDDSETDDDESSEETRKAKRQGKPEADQEHGRTSHRSDGLMDEAEIMARMKKEKKVQKGSDGARQRIEQEMAEWEKRKVSGKSRLDEDTNRVLGHGGRKRY